jgi:E3 ubiquitin-protein ligase RGLG
MEHYDDALPLRRFDNFQFVNFTSIVRHHLDQPDVVFATSALMEIPDQYNIIHRLGYLGSMLQQVPASAF